MEKPRRPLRVLHIGNIANNAYNIAKVQRRNGIEADVLCYDYYHIMGTPEWEDAEFEGDLRDQFYPAWEKVNLNGFKRPKWFAQGPLLACCQYLSAKGSGHLLKSKHLWKVLEWERISYCCQKRQEPSPSWTPGVYSLLPEIQLRWGKVCERAAIFLAASAPRDGWHGLRKPVYLALASVAFLAISMVCLLRAAFGLLTALWGKRNNTAEPVAKSSFNFDEHKSKLLRDFRAAFPHWADKLNENDLNDYAYAAGLFQELFAKYDIVQGYCTDPIWPMLCDYRTYVAYEHGTVRDLPAGANVTSRLAALAYRKSPHVFITNGDCESPARELGITRYSSTLHGIDDTKFRRDEGFRQRVLREHDVDRLYLCPIRHSWDIKGTDRYIRALKAIAGRIGSRFRLVTFTWGDQVQDSKELAIRLGVDSFIVWKEPVPHPTLARWYGAVDCVFDQIALPNFGATAVEAMGCGTPVIMSYDPKATTWIIPEPAPILTAWTTEEIVEHVGNLLQEEYRSEVSKRSRNWFSRNHTTKRSLEDHLSVYGQILRRSHQGNEVEGGAREEDCESVVGVES